MREGTENVDAWLNVVQVRSFFYQSTRDSHARATYRLLGQSEKAISAFEQMRKIQGNAWQTPLFLAAIYSEMGREEEVRK